MNQHQKQLWLGVILVVISAFGYALMPALSAAAYALNLNVSQVLFYRFAVAAVCAWVYIALLRIPVKMSFKQLVYLMIIGFLGYTICSKVLFIGYQYVSGSIATMILFAHPLFVVLGESFLEKKMPSRYKWGAMGLTMVGLIVILFDPSANYSNYGLLMCFLSALTYAIYCLGLTEKGIRTLHPMLVTAVVVTLSAVYNLVECIQFGSFGLAQAQEGWLVVLSLGVFATVIPAVTFFSGLKIVGSGSATIISAVEPAFVYWIEVVILGGPLLFKNILGGVIIALGILLLQKE